MDSGEIERLVRGLQTAQIATLGGTRYVHATRNRLVRPCSFTLLRRWFEQHRVHERLLASCHSAAVSGSECAVTAAVATWEGFRPLLSSLLAAEAWRVHVYPLLRTEAAGRDSSVGMRVYFIHYSEAVVTSLLSSICFYRYAVESAGDLCSDLCDYAVRAITDLISSSATRAAAVEDAPEEGNLSQFVIWERDMRFRRGVTCVALLRLLVDVLPSLPFSILSRCATKHDIPCLMVPLIENPPWVRKRRTADGGFVWEKYHNSAWVLVDAKDLLKITPVEAQPWLCMYNMLLEPEVRKIYTLGPHRKAVLTRVRKYLNEVLIDQLPLLAGLQRTLDEMAVMAVPDATPGKSGLLLETIPVVQEQLMKEALKAPFPTASGATDDTARTGSEPANRTWQDVANWMLSNIFVAAKKGSAFACDADLAKMADIYHDDTWMDAALGDPTCYKCGAAASKRCSRCKNVWYCSRECQVGDWKEHKQLCDIVTAAPK
jgi:hypothetical protein